MIAFGGLSWALDGAAAPVAALARLEPAMAAAGALPVERPRGPPTGHARARDPLPRRDVRLPARPAARCSTASTSRSRPARRWRSSAQNGAGKTTLAKLLCRLYDPQSGQHRDRRRRPARRSTSTRGARGSPRCSRTSSASSCRCATNVAPARRARRRRSSPRCATRAPIDLAGPRHDPRQGLRGRHRPLRRAVAARRARARAVRGARWARASCCSTSRPRSSTCAARPRSSSACSPRRATRTTILVSHRFSTVRQADRICVVEHGRVVELGTHDELMALGGRYRTMFDLQASRFADVELDEHGEEVVHDTLA